MKNKKLKTLFIVLTAALAITGANYAAGYNFNTVYAAESADVVSVGDDAAVTDVQDKAGKVDIKVSYNNETSANSIDPVITITNNSDEEMNLADLNLKYYYPSNTETNEVFACYYAGTVDGNYRSLTANVEGTLEKCDHIEDTADADANITFNGGTLDAGQSMTIQASIHKEDWTNYDVTDKSLCCISAYMDGKLVYGSEAENDYLTYDISDGECVLGDNMLSYVNISGTELPVQGEFNLTYDPDTFKVLYADINSPNGNEENQKVEIDPEKGIIHVSYDNSNIDPRINKIPLSMVLGLQVKNHAKVGETTIGFENIPGDKNMGIRPGHLGKINIKQLDDGMPKLIVEDNIYQGRKDIYVYMHQNGNDFLGIEGLEEGTDYTFDGISTLILKSSALARYFPREIKKLQYVDFNLEFENGIKEPVSIGYYPLPIC